MYPAVADVASPVITRIIPLETLIDDPVDNNTDPVDPLLAVPV